MKTGLRVLILAVVVNLSLALSAFSATRQETSGRVTSGQASATGQTATLLPDGNWLLAGGQDATGRPVGTLALRDAQGQEKPLNTALRFARTWHTATVLPDGSVLILGGIGADGLVVQVAELFHPETQTVTVLPSTELPDRVFHSSTLLTEGQTLVAGGVSPSGQLSKTIELIDSRTKSTIVLPVELATARRNHTATLLPDGRVLLWGGKDAFGQPLNYGEVYDPKTYSLVQEAIPFNSAADAAPPFLAASIPEDGATDVDVDGLIALRFSKPMRAELVNQQSVTLQDSNGAAVTARVVAAEGGMLAFVTPDSALEPATRYTVSMSSLADASGLAFIGKSISFTTTNGDGENWIPSWNWQTGHADSPWRALPPLQAPSGVTAIAGQVLTLDGKPLANVTLRVGIVSARSDGTGRFLLLNIGAGHVSMFMDGRTANKPRRTYGTFEVGVDVRGGQTNALDFTIWMPLIDTDHQVTIPSPTTSEVIVTTPLIPGLELHIPPNTVIIDYDGQVVHQVGITPIPVDRPPFPLPASVYVPIYFTAQPGGAYVKNYSSGAQQGVRVIYPNYRNLAPGARGSFWHYDPDGKGWYVYGMGTVTPDARQVVPDPGVSIYEFTGAMFNPNGRTPPGTGADSGRGGASAGEPVDLATGLFIYSKTDLFLPDLIPISLTRTYRPGDSNSGPFGIGTWHPYEMYVWNPTQPQYQEVDLIQPDGSRVHYSRISSGTSWSDAVFQNTTSNGAFYKSLIVWNGNGWNLTLKDGTVFVIGENNPLQAIRDRYGNQLTITRANGQSGNITQLTSPNGRWIKFTYDGSNRITQATDNIGRTVLYSYDGGGRLTQVTDVNGGIWKYSYDTANEMITITDARNILYLTNVYDTNGRVTKQIQADNSTFQFAYTLDGTKNIIRTDVTDPRGNVRRVTFSAPSIFPDGFQSGGQVVSDTHALGLPEQQTVSYDYGAGGANPANFTQSITDPLGRQTTFTYDAMGNTTSITRLAGTAQAVITSAAYKPVFNQTTSVTDALNHTTSFSYDARGNLTTVTNPLGNQFTFTYNSVGQVTSATDPLGNTGLFGYSGGDPVSVTDPLGNTTTRLLDGTGRVVSVVDPAGHSTKFQYNNLNLLTQITDAQGNNTGFSYDPNGNLLSLTDALNHTTIWTYDTLDRTATRKDPLQRLESYSYDLNGNLASATDRKNQVTSFTYDALNRLTFAGYNTVVSGGVPSYESTTSFTYDAGDRLNQVMDSSGGTITEGYDNLDRLNSESSPQGTVSYGYDSVGRRTSMTVAGQPQVSYTYDNANRLTHIMQGTSNVGFVYDNLSRRASLTLPNGVSVAYSFDYDSQVTGIAYSSSANTFGNLIYAYDQLGRRTQEGGSFARTGLPGPVPLAVYDAANELTNWKGASISYDNNGNMLSDGSNVFTWNARDQVATLNSGSLQYDGMGRRIKNATGKSFFYDGANAAQELSGTTITATMWTGDLDEIFQRTDSGGTVVPITDGLGSVVALTDASGNLTTQYAYDPFGSTMASGTPSANPAQYTGRENEGNGLYYHRARYYSPSLGRFISEDPLGFVGSGSNVYAYAGDDPIDFSDPFGLRQGDWWDSRSYDFSHISGWDVLQDFGNTAEGFTDALTLGSASRLNDALGNSRFVDRCGIGHKLGSAAGIVASIALGSGLGAEAAEANAGKKGFEFSHWYPKRLGGPRSIYNGNFVSAKFHYLTDFYRYPAPPGAALRWGPKLPAAAQQILRIPWVYDGAAAGALYGGAGVMAGRSCGCD